MQRLTKVHTSFLRRLLCLYSSTCIDIQSIGWITFIPGTLASLCNWRHTRCRHMQQWTNKKPFHLLHFCVGYSKEAPLESKEEGANSASLNPFCIQVTFCTASSASKSAGLVTLCPCHMHMHLLAKTGPCVFILCSPVLYKLKETFFLPKSNSLHSWGRFFLPKNPRENFVSIWTETVLPFASCFHFPHELSKAKTLCFIFRADKHTCAHQFPGQLAQGRGVLCLFGQSTSAPKPKSFRE